MAPGDKPRIGWGWFFMAPGDLFVELLVYLVVTGTVSITSKTVIFINRTV